MQFIAGRRHLLARFVLGFCAVPFLSSCVHRPIPARAPRIGFIIGEGYPDLVAAFESELSRLGYADGRNIHVERRISRTNTSDAVGQCAELAHMNLDLVLATALPFAMLIRAANPHMPMVVMTGPGLVSNGFAQTMEHPGGVVTGMDELPSGVTGRRLHLLKEAAPHIRRVALLSTTPGAGGHETQLADAQRTARQVAVEVTPYRSANPSQLRESLQGMLHDGMDALLTFQGGLALSNRQLIVDFAAEHRLPAVYQSVLFPEAGGLMSWAPDQNEQMRRAVRTVDRILQGARPGDLPITHPAKYFLTINLSAAKRIGLSLPAHLLQRADRTIA
jgi:putative tryptophan/tyrosine transport system substrate-binding protein